MTELPDILPVGIRREAGRGFIVECRVRPYPKRRKRFPLDTPLSTMLAWRETQLDELEAARRALRRSRTAMDPLASSRGLPAITTTLREDIETYLTQKLRPTLHPDTRDQFERWLRTAAAGELGRYPRDMISGAMWASLLAQWERSGIPMTPGVSKRERTLPPGPLAVDTVHKIRTCFIGFYDVMDAGLELPNPARAIPRREKDWTPEPRGIPMALAHRILDHVTGGRPSRTAARLTLVCVLGLRPVEIMRIKPTTDWHRKERTLAVRTAKGGKNRTLPLNDRAVAALELLARLDAWGKFSSAPAARLFHQAVEAAGLQHLEPVRPYDLRHTFGTEAYRVTKDIKATAAAMGHKNLSQTERYVEASVSENVAQLFEAMNRAMPPAPRQKRRRGALREVK